MFPKTEDREALSIKEEILQEFLIWILFDFFKYAQSDI